MRGVNIKSGKVFTNSALYTVVIAPITDLNTVNYFS